MPALAAAHLLRASGAEVRLGPGEEVTGLLTGPGGAVRGCGPPPACGTPRTW